MEALCCRRTRGGRKAGQSTPAQRRVGFYVRRRGPHPQRARAVRTHTIRQQAPPRTDAVATFTSCVRRDGKRGRPKSKRPGQGRMRTPSSLCPQIRTDRRGHRTLVDRKFRTGRGKRRPVCVCQTRWAMGSWMSRGEDVEWGRASMRTTDALSCPGAREMPGTYGEAPMCWVRATPRGTLWHRQPWPPQLQTIKAFGTNGRRHLGRFYLRTTTTRLWAHVGHVGPTGRRTTEPRTPSLPPSPLHLNSCGSRLARPVRLNYSCCPRDHPYVATAIHV